MAKSKAVAAASCAFEYLIPKYTFRVGYRIDRNANIHERIDSCNDRFKTNTMLLI